MKNVMKYIPKKLHLKSKHFKIEDTDFKLLLEYAPDAIFIETNWKFSFVNKIGLELFGAKSKKELLTKPILNYVAIDDKEKFSKLIQGAIEGEKSHHSLEIQMVRVDGTYIPVSTTAIPFKFSGLRGVLFFVKNLSILNKTKKLLEISLKKEETTKSLKLSFLRNLSHEVKTPLNSIKGFADLLTTPNLSPEKQKEFVKIINYNIDSLSNLISKTVSMSLLDSHQDNLAIVSFPVEVLLDDLYDYFFRTAQLRHIDFVLVKPKEDTGRIIYTDQKKVYEVLFNLLENAFKFTEAGKIEFGYRMVDQEAVFYVKDTGPGIPKVYQDVVFERFFQIETPLTKVHSGTGLGLSISKALAELLGGKIWFESEEENGATFYFSVPSLEK